MIQLLTKVNIIDNSGGAIGKCIKILNPHGRNYAKVGDIILVSIKETLKLNNITSGAHNKVVKGSLFKALVVRTKVSSIKNSGTFDDNAVILLKSNVGSSAKVLTELAPLGTRIKGPISIELSLKNGDNKYQKILSLSKLHY